MIIIFVLNLESINTWIIYKDGCVDAIKYQWPHSDIAIELGLHTQRKNNQQCAVSHDLVLGSLIL